MRTRRVQLEGDVVEDLFNIYRDKGYPLGKNRRGRKKWASRFVNRLLAQFIKDEGLDKSTSK